jgi:hypothetical protein
MRIFTKCFFALSHNDQVAIVDAALNDLRALLGQVQPQNRSRVKRRIRRIEKKAEEYGLYDPGEELDFGEGPTAKAEDVEKYAEVAWLPTDIMARFGVSGETAREFLSHLEGHLKEAMLRLGWDAIDMFGREMGWTPRNWDQTLEAMERLIHVDGEEEQPPSKEVDWLHGGF